MGSSPRVRGKQGRLVGADRERGLIPACAGKTTASRSSSSTATAHPRVCGENPLRGAAQSCGHGSSPRVRGKPRDVDRAPQPPRLILACAGKTRFPLDDAPLRPAHPRVCGENAGAGDALPHRGGSSPRVRGKLLRHRQERARVRLIPACAGKTSTRGKSIPQKTAHPRVCGENQVNREFAESHSGSSPRVRGKRSRAPPDRRARRLIPACAGKTRFAHW